MAPIRLNVFQLLTRHWDELHPYNAAQMMKLSGRADQATLNYTWRETLRELGLGRVHVSGRRYWWDNINHAAVGDDVIDVPADHGVEQFLSDHLNAPFDPSNSLPFRPFVARQSDGYWLGAVYHHWVADSYSIRLLLREWFLRLHDPSSALRQSLRLARAGYWRLFGPARGRWTLDQAIFGMLRWSARFRKARRVDPEAFGDLSVRFSLHRLPDELIDELLPAARRRGVTINDVFLAAAARVCDQLAPVRRTPRRPNLALGTIVDLRSHLPGQLDDTFGMYLGFSSVFCTADELRDGGRLLRRINRQNELNKSTAAAEASMVRMCAGLLAAGLLGRERLMEFYRKRLALACGVSNINLNRDWPARHHPQPLMDYVRVSPAGPMMPIVFTPTTLGRRLNFGLTCRAGIINRERSRAMAEAFAAALGHFAATGCIV